MLQLFAPVFLYFVQNGIIYSSFAISVFVLRPLQIFLFPKMKLRLKRRHFDTTEEIHAESQDVIDTLTFDNFQEYMKSWETRWDRCMHAQGDYSEG
jgi:hypothetical protein